jgi:hypothetical protein
MINGTAKWTPSNRGNDALPAQTTSSPSFIHGDGSEDNPFAISDVTTLGGTFVRSQEVITIGGFAPYQYVPITDINAEVNGNRFSASSYFTDGNGVLTFRVLFTDYPISSGGVGYAAKLEVGFGSVFVSAAVTIATPLALSSVGSIQGTPEVGKTLTYSVGQAGGGSAPYQYQWEWRKSSDGGLLQSNGNTLVIPESLDGDRVYVALTATDSNNTKVFGSTAGYPTSPNIIAKGEFPVTDILFPTTLKDSSGLPREVSTLWLDAGTTLSSNGCIEIKVNGGVWGQGPYSIVNGDTLNTRWVQNGSGNTCGDALNNTTITGCVYSSSYKQCASLLLDRIPSPFSFLPQNELQLNSTATSDPVTPLGYNSSGYITYSGISTVTNIQASLDNGSTWVNVPVIGNDTLVINPGQSLMVRGTVGSVKNTEYKAVINIGQGQSIQTATFSATTTNQTTFDTPINFPTLTTQGYSVTQIGGVLEEVPAPETVWTSADGATNLTSTGCLEIKITTGAGVLKYDWGTGGGGTPIATGDKLYVRWAKDNVPPSDSCGDASHGTQISGTITNGTKTTPSTLSIDRVTGAYDFFNLSGQGASSQVSSNTVTISGNNSTVYLTASGTLSAIQASVNGGTWSSVPSSGTSFPIFPEPSTVTLQIRGTTGAGINTTYSANVVIGDGASAISTDVWEVTTSAAQKTVITPSITSPSNGATGINPTTLNPAGVTVQASTYQATNGASSTQLNSEWEIRSGSTTGTVVYSQIKTSGTLNSWFVPLMDGATSVLQPNTDYFLRVRYESQDNVKSEWSPYSQFKTATVFTQTWVLRTSVASFTAAEDQPRNCIANNGSLWMVVDKEEKVITSSDAITWSPVASVGDGTAPWGLTFGSGLWMVLRNNNPKIKVSTNNGLTWSAPANSGLTTSARSIAFGNGTFVIVGGDVIQTSPDGNAWTTRPTPNNVSGLSGVIWDGSNFIAVGNGCIIYSSTGTSWTRVSTPANQTDLQISFLPGSTNTYMIVRPYRRPIGGDTSTSSNYISTNLTSWSTETLPSTRIQFGAGGNGVFVAGTWNDNVTGLTAWSSATGLTGTWTSQNLPTVLTKNKAAYLNFGTTSTGIGRFVLIDQDFNIFSTI